MKMKIRFSFEPLYKIIETLKKELEYKNEIQFCVLDPDISPGSYNGEKFFINNKTFIYRGFRSWVDLAGILECRILTPLKNDDHTVTIKYKKIDKNSSFHNDSAANEKYGADSIFAKINKNEEPSFLHYYMQALKNTKINEKNSILNLGINKGDEFEVIKNISDNFCSKKLTGIDYSPSIIKKACEKFSEDGNISFLCADINKLNDLGLGKFDLIISIGTLQSTNVEFKPLFMSLIQNYLFEKGALILGFPNCRWIDGEMIYGAKSKNYSFAEASLLHKDIYFCKKYLQQKKFRVTITGKDYLFLTATSIKNSNTYS